MYNEEKVTSGFARVTAALKIVNREPVALLTRSESGELFWLNFPGCPDSFQAIHTACSHYCRNHNKDTKT